MNEFNISRSHQAWSSNFSKTSKTRKCLVGLLYANTAYIMKLIFNHCRVLSYSLFLTCSMFRFRATITNRKVGLPKRRLPIVLQFWNTQVWIIWTIILMPFLQPRLAWSLAHKSNVTVIPLCRFQHFKNRRNERQNTCIHFISLFIY